jgi:hypothetical protein
MECKKSVGYIPSWWQVVHVIPRLVVNTFFFSKAHPYIQHICRFQQLWNNINNINSIWLFIKLLFHHLEHLHSLGKRHANRLNELAGLYSVPLLYLFVSFLFLLSTVSLRKHSIVFRFSVRWRLVCSSRAAGRSRTSQYVTLCINQLTSQRHSDIVIFFAT